MAGRAFVFWVMPCVELGPFHIVVTRHRLLLYTLLAYAIFLTPSNGSTEAPA